MSNKGSNLHKSQSQFTTLKSAGTFSQNNLCPGTKSISGALQQQLHDHVKEAVIVEEVENIIDME